MVFIKSLIAVASILAAVAAAPLEARREGAVVQGVPAHPVEFKGKPGKDVYHFYKGDGSQAHGWPKREDWVPFGAMFKANEALMRISCEWMGVPDPSKQEIQDMHDSIVQESKRAKTDPRFMLAVMMQESNGCPRVHTTGNGVRNPGLMQDHNGRHSCNDASVGGVKTPCPRAQIDGMIRDGTGGTASGDGLAALINQAARSTGKESAWPFYKAARLYNSGSIARGGDLNNPNGATASYACDIANRLMGWVKAPSKFA